MRGRGERGFSKTMEERGEERKLTICRKLGRAIIVLKEKQTAGGREGSAFSSSNGEHFLHLAPPIPVYFNPTTFNMVSS